MPQILDGKIVREEIFANLKPRVAAVQAKLGRPPGLAVVLVGEDPASKQYVQNKIKGCADLGICSRKVAPPATISTEQLLKDLDKLNHDPA
ncbi:MAG: bifunctional methylenetetrahydrofolate dehydrogenase/methenyltetrahydrofolate cyclohydrolase, partial [Bryobacterales bacterium]|nr:bifunctional methylenetetrahydrofolate dehydrogenase/methenyltetrahydrofolate cyclohydrolase [Bryobacterales bacterium]